LQAIDLKEGDLADILEFAVGVVEKGQGGCRYKGEHLSDIVAHLELKSIFEYR